MVLPPAVTMKVARPIDQPQRAVAPFADIAGVQPAVGVFDLARRFLVAPITFEQVGAAHQHFAVLSQQNFEALDRRADIARAREGAALAGDDAAGFLGLPVHLDDVDAVHLPKRRRFRPADAAPPLTTSSSLSKPSLLRIGRKTAACSAR